MIRAAVKNTMGMTMDRSQILKWMREHLVDVPVKHMAYQFETNGLADFSERSGSADRVQAEESQAQRAREMMETHKVCFAGKESLNTLLCVVYSKLSVCQIIHAANAESEVKNRLSHAFVLRFGDVFLLLLTGGAYQRFPLASCMQNGKHTSAYIYLNLKESCWAPYLGSPRMKKQKRFQTLSQATVSGVNILSVLWRRAALLERNTDAGKCHIYRQPPAKALTVKQGVPAAGLQDGEGSAPSSSADPDGWVWEIEHFAEQFAQSSAGAVDSPEEKLLVAEEPPAAAVAAPPSDAAARA
jgi:hypothetical protein